MTADIMHCVCVAAWWCVDSAGWSGLGCVSNTCSSYSPLDASVVAEDVAVDHQSVQPVAHTHTHTQV